MSVRAAVILVENDRLCLIERQRAGTTYYLFPGGTVDEGETPEQAARREAREELGLDVRVGDLAERITFAGDEQLYFHATRIGGTFGEGTGDELASPPDSEAGTYLPTWVPLDALEGLDVRPKNLADDLRDCPLPQGCVEPDTDPRAAKRREAPATP